MLAWAGSASAIIIWEETDKNITIYDGDNTEIDFYTGDAYTVDIELVDPGYTSLIWGIDAFAMNGWEDTGPYVDYFTITASLDGTELKSETYTPAGAGGSSTIFFEIDLPITDSITSYIGTLSIENVTSMSSNAEWWNLLDAKLTGDEATPTPEPATMLLMGSGLAGIAAARSKKKASKV